MHVGCLVTACTQPHGPHHTAAAVLSVILTGSITSLKLVWVLDPLQRADFVLYPAEGESPYTAMPFDYQCISLG